MSSHPAYAESWEWDEGNESELAAHHIVAEEVEQVLTNGPKWARNKKGRSGDWKMVGLTDGARALTIVVRYDSDRKSLRPITGWGTTKGERTRYL